MIGDFVIALAGVVIVLIASDGISDLYRHDNTIQKWAVAFLWIMVSIIGSGIALFPLVRELCSNL